MEESLSSRLPLPTSWEATCWRHGHDPDRGTLRACGNLSCLHSVGTYSTDGCLSSAVTTGVVRSLLPAIVVMCSRTQSWAELPNLADLTRKFRVEWAGVLLATGAEWKVERKR